ncbi:target of Myb1 membrane trafficking protein isoform X3 [Amia ocellicauda]|uniref:target of Myb1 membrane trafficking protein isoform X3 n=1 Tax=Amia ocellicauda TaxID=2972642 RepID=UPI0034648A2C
MDFLIGNPFSSPVGQRIEHATSATLQSEDWGLNMEICDIINETEEGPKDAVRALKKRIVGNKNFREVMLALTVLEACVKNCGHRFHVLVASRDFVEGVLVRTILPRNNPPHVITERVLSLIQAWADAFRSAPSLTGVVSVYEDLRRKGLEFPMTDLDALSPIHTPQRSVPDSELSPSPALGSVAPSAVSGGDLDPTLTLPLPLPAEGPLTPTSDQVAKLTCEVEVVRGNVTVMSDMLSAMDPAHSEPSDLELLQELNRTCRVMQCRVVELIPRLGAESLIEELLSLNDQLNTAFTRYDRFERLRTGASVSSQAPPPSNNLIDLSPAPTALSQPVPSSRPIPEPVSQSAVGTLSSQLASLSTGPASGGQAGDEEFDMFAQTRGSSLAEQRKSVRYEDPRAVEGLAGALDTRLQNTGAEPNPEPAPLSSSPHSDWMIPVTQTCVMDDIEQWLSVDMQEDDTADAEGVTSEEFDRFLEERAKAAERLPPLAPPSDTPRPAPETAARQQENTHDQLFAL